MKIKKEVYIVSPTYNASNQLLELYESLEEQQNKNWKWIILNDMSTDDTLSIAQKICEKDKYDRVSIVDHKQKKFALKGIYDYLHSCKEIDDNAVIAIIDGDDALCNENTIDLVLTEYEKNPNLDALWTSHSWDINGMNISREIPGNLNPYQYPWVSSHLKTFKLDTFLSICEENFKDLDDNWFERGYDQALYLPILYLAKERKFCDEICYLYRINSNSLKVRDWKEKNQLDTIRLVRARGYVE